MYSVAVVMSTYNGEKYLIEQLESILSQKEVKVDVYVRDDGSTDDTISILTTMSNNNQNIYIEKADNVGVGNSFMNALYNLRYKKTYDYYAFADQDDVWLPEKLSVAIKKLHTKEGKLLYVSNQIVVDSQLNSRHLRFSSNPDIKFGNILRGNVISGCTFVMNYELYDFLTDEKNRPSTQLLKIRIHDVWVAAIAAMFGKIIYDSDGYILYRQHSSNVVGAMELSWFDKLKKKAKYITHKNYSGKVMADELINIFGDRLADKLAVIDVYSKYIDNLTCKYHMLRLENEFKHYKESKFEYQLKVLLNQV